MPRRSFTPRPGKGFPWISSRRGRGAPNRARWGSPEPAFSLVLYINQTTDGEGNRQMRKTTEQLIDLTIAHKGRFFLPYQLYYSRDQLQRSYPQINDFFAAKRRYDPTELFTNTFYQKYAS